MVMKRCIHQQHKEAYKMQERQMEKNLNIHQLEDEVDYMRMEIEEL